MKLIGGHDYYDIVLAYGNDNDLIFVRDHSPILSVKELPITIPPKVGVMSNKDKKLFWKFSSTIYYKHQKLYEIIPIYVIFCGKRYGIVKLQNCGCPNLVSQYDYFAASEETLAVKLAQYGYSLSNYKRSIPSFSTHNINEFFRIVDLNIDQKRYLLDNHIVIAICRYPIGDYTLDKNNPSTFIHWEINSSKLKSVEFYKLIDPITAFQEISMWLGNMVQPARNIIEISDQKIKLAKAGFDKFSFKNKKLSYKQNKV